MRNGDNWRDLIIIAHPSDSTMSYNKSNYPYNTQNSTLFCYERMDLQFSMLHLHKQTFSYTEQIVWILEQINDKFK